MKRKIRVIEEYLNWLLEKDKCKLNKYQFNGIVALCYNVGVTKFRYSVLYGAIRHNEEPRLIKKYFRQFKYDENGEISKEMEQLRKREFLFYVNKKK